MAWSDEYSSLLENSESQKGVGNVPLLIEIRNNRNYNEYHLITLEVKSKMSALKMFININI